MASILAQLRVALGECYGQRLIRILLFGSRARGDHRADSDIDVLVILRGPVRPADEIARTGGIVADLSLRHSCLISCLFMDEHPFRTGNGPFLLNVRREAVPV